MVRLERVSLMPMEKSKRYGTRVMLNRLQDGDISYFAVFKLAGDRYNTWIKVGKKSEGITEAKTLEVRNQKLSEARHGSDLSHKKINHLTLDNLAELYFRNNAAHIKSITQYLQRYQKHIAPSIGEIVIAKLDDEDVAHLQQIKKYDGLSKSSINGIIKLLVRIINYAIERGIIKQSPFRKIRHFKVSNSRLRYLSQDEIDHLLDMLQDEIMLKLFVVVALGTGARAEGVLAIQKKHIDKQNRSVLLQDFKRNNTYRGYLDDDTFNGLLKHIEDFRLNDYVVSISGKKTKYQTLYKKLTPYLEIFNQDLSKSDRANRVVIHTLRHTFASHLAIAGVGIQEIQKLLNHRDINQTLKYAKLTPDSGRKHVKELYRSNK